MPAELSTTVPANIGPDVFDPWSDYLKKDAPQESLSDTIRRRQAETKKKVEEILRKTPEVRGAIEIPVPESPPGMPRRKRQAYKGERRICMTGGSCCEKSESGTQTQISLPHVARDVLWTASCLDAVADFEDESASIVIESPVNVTGLGVLEVDSVEMVNYDDVITDDTDDEMLTLKSEDESDDPNAEKDNEANESDVAENVDRNEDDDAQTGSSRNEAMIMLKSLTVLTNTSAKATKVARNPGQQEASKTSRSDKKKQKKKMQRQRKKTRTTEETDEKDGHLGEAAPKSASSSMSSILGTEELQRYSPFTSVPALISSAGREPKKGSRVESPGAESIKAGGEPGHIGPEESMSSREHCQANECFAHFNMDDSLEVHSTNSLEVHSTTHLGVETSICQSHFDQSSFASLTSSGACEALESIQQTGHLPQGLAKSRTGAKTDSDGEDDFETPECWKEKEKTISADSQHSSNSCSMASQEHGASRLTRQLMPKRQAKCRTRSRTTLRTD